MENELLGEHTIITRLAAHYRTLAPYVEKSTLDEQLYHLAGTLYQGIKVQIRSIGEMEQLSGNDEEYVAHLLVKTYEQLGNPDPAR